jgi:hypothetical protein
MAGVRPFVEGDVVAVADLVWKVLHGRDGHSPPSLKVYFSELFLHNPWRDDGIVSNVYEDNEGRIVGFFGAVPRRMTIQGKRIRLAFGSNFVMDPASRATMAAIQLVRTFMKGPQDVSITDSANENSRQLLRSLGFNIVPIYSLLWARPLKPFRYGLEGLTRLKKTGLVRVLSTVLTPVCYLADAIAARIPLNPLHVSRPQGLTEDLSSEVLLELLARIPAKNLLLPEYDKGSIDWVLNFIGKEKAFGEVRKRVVRNDEHKPIGWFLYYASPGAIGEVLQIGAESASVGRVLDHLFYDALHCGLIGLHGRLEPQLMQELTLKSCFFLRNGSWTLAHSSKLDLLNLIQSGAAFFSRLDGEWALRPGPDGLMGADPLTN